MNKPQSYDSFKSLTGNDSKHANEGHNYLKIVKKTTPTDMPKRGTEIPDPHKKYAVVNVQTTHRPGQTEGVMTDEVETLAKKIRPKDKIDYVKVASFAPEKKQESTDSYYDHRHADEVFNKAYQVLLKEKELHFQKEQERTQKSDILKASPMSGTDDNIKPKSFTTTGQTFNSLASIGNLNTNDKAITPAQTAPKHTTPEATTTTPVQQIENADKELQQKVYEIVNDWEVILKAKGNSPEENKRNQESLKEFEEDPYLWARNRSIENQLRLQQELATTTDKNKKDEIVRELIFHANDIALIDTAREKKIPLQVNRVHTRDQISFPNGKVLDVKNSLTSINAYLGRNETFYTIDGTLVRGGETFVVLKNPQGELIEFDIAAFDRQRDEKLLSQLVPNTTFEIVQKGVATTYFIEKIEGDTLYFKGGATRGGNTTFDELKKMLSAPDTTYRNLTIGQEKAEPVKPAVVPDAKESAQNKEVIFNKLKKEYHTEIDPLKQELAELTKLYNKLLAQEKEIESKKKSTLKPAAAPVIATPAEQQSPVINTTPTQEVPEQPKKEESQKIEKVGTIYTAEYLEKELRDNLPILLGGRSDIKKIKKFNIKKIGNEVNISASITANTGVWLSPTVDFDLNIMIGEKNNTADITKQNISSSSMFESKIREKIEPSLPELIPSIQKYLASKDKDGRIVESMKVENGALVLYFKDKQ